MAAAELYLWLCLMMLLLYGNLCQPNVCILCVHIMYMCRYMCVSNTQIPVSVSTVGMCVHDIMCMVSVYMWEGEELESGLKDKKWN